MGSWMDHGVLCANSISAANDLTVLFPRWINIRRGCMVAAVIAGWVLVPWKILSSADTFLAFMGGYSVFLAPISGIMAADYWLVKRTHYDLPALYNPDGRYHYIGGCNWRAAVAFLVPVAPLLPGLANSITETSGGSLNLSPGISNLYSFDWLFGFVTSIVLYTLLSKIFPARETLLNDTIWDLGTIEGVVEGGSDEEKGSKGEKGDSPEIEREQPLHHIPTDKPF